MVKKSKLNNRKERVRTQEIKRRDFFRKLTYAGTGLLALGGIGYLFYGNSRGIQELTLEKLRGTSEVKTVESFGDSLDVIYIPFAHPNQVSSLAIGKERNAYQIKTICEGLYDRFGVHSLLLEGIDEEASKEYTVSGKLSLNSGNKTMEGKNDDEAISSIINNRRWNLYPGENLSLCLRNEELSLPLRKVHDDFNMYIQKRAERLNEEIREGNVQEEKLVKIAEKEMEEKRKIAIKNLDELMTKQFVDEYCYNTIFNRNQHVCGQAILCKNEGKAPLIVVYGAHHGRELLKLFSRNNLGGITLISEGFSEELQSYDSVKVIRNIFDIGEIKLSSQ